MPSEGDKALRSEWKEGVLVVSFTDPTILDEDRIQRIGCELMEMVVAVGQSKKLLINFQGVKVMSSAMIGKLVLLKSDGELVLVEATSKRYRELARATVFFSDSIRIETRALPALSDGRLFIRDTRTLKCLDLSKPKN